MNILFLITARGGSKSVPKKNLSKIGGVSLIGFKAISALRSKYCSRLIISSDDQEIQQDAASYGVEVPFTRPAELATDTASSFDVIRHAMDWIEANTDEKYDAIMLLEPSAPFATSVDFNNAVEMMIEKNANAVIGMREMEINSLFVGELDEQGRMTQIIDQMKQRYLRRQDTKPEYTMNGALYLFKWDLFKEHHTMYVDRENTYGYIMDREHSIEIDEPIDLQWAEFLVERGVIDMSYWR
ncbi:MAG TPA: acylneuraminate cytidylyltransferase family protein [Pyrinomonadaceae bacterium]